MADFKTIDDAGDLTGKRVLVRVDINVPMADGKVTDDTRLRAAVPTLRAILDKGGLPIILAHFGRPKGQVVPEMSLAPLAKPLAALLGSPVTFSEKAARSSAGRNGSCRKHAVLCDGRKERPSNGGVPRILRRPLRQ